MMPKINQIGLFLLRLTAVLCLIAPALANAETEAQYLAALAQYNSCVSSCGDAGPSCITSICGSAPTPPSSQPASNNEAITAAASSDIMQRKFFQNTNNSINKHLFGLIFHDLTTPTSGETSSNSGSYQAASADSSSFTPNSGWSNFDWSRLSSNGSANGSFNSDLYQTLAGIDKKIGNFYFGATLNYAGSTNHIVSANTYGSTQMVGFTPYAAYVVNKNFFLSGLVGYNYSANNFRGVAPDSQMDTYMSEFDLNGLEVFGNWYAKAKTGFRYLHSYTRANGQGTTPANGSNIDSWTYLLDLEGGYSFANGIRAYNSILYENLSSTLASTLVTTGVVNANLLGNNIFYYTAGADYAVNKRLFLGTKIQTDLNNSATNLTTISLNARYLFD